MRPQPGQMVVLLVVALVVVAAGVYLARASAGDRSPAAAKIVAPLPSDPNAADAETIASLRRAGSDVSRPTHIVHYLYLPAQNDANKAAAALRARGYDANVRTPLGKLPDGSVSNDWGVVAATTAVPSIETFRKARPLFEALARKYHGTYDGWEAAVVK